MSAPIVSRDPHTGQTLKTFSPATAQEISDAYARARAAQAQWSQFSLRRRLQFVSNLSENLLHHADELIQIISSENGKPRFEALANEILPVADTCKFLRKVAPRALRDREIKLSLMKHKRSYLHPQPLGVVLIISPWNYPFLLPMGEILPAVVAGNAVVFKPSEVTTWIGVKIQELFDQSGFPPHLVQTVVGDGAVGSALIDQKPAKVFFTGSVATGRRVMMKAAESLTPVNLELGGKDPMIILQDADLDLATSAALWGGFSNAGQMCSSVERILVHDKVREEFTGLLLEKARTLTHSKEGAAHYEIGAITLDRQKSIYASQIDEAHAQGAKFLLGGDFKPADRAMVPTLVSGDGIESLSIYNEETFGPVIAITGFSTPAEAVKKANQSHYGLNAYLYTRNLGLGEALAKQLEAGSVLINEVAYTAGLPETPWGGVKESGFGRSHSELGLMECVHLKHIHRPRNLFPTLKSPWWFPYSPFQYATFRALLRTYHQRLPDRVKAFAETIWNAVKMLKKEPRL